MKPAGRMMVVLAVGVALMAQDAEAQRRRGGRSMSNFDHTQYNVDYNGRFTFLRLRYMESGWGRGGAGWAHDYPTAEQNFAQILEEISLVDARQDGTNILTLDDPEVFRYPLAYLSEPGYWQMNAEELEGFRNYLLKGGMMIVDDFRDNQWYNFDQQMQAAFPNLQAIRLEETHPVFNSFFQIVNLDQFYHPYGSSGPAEFYGYFVDNDPAKRMLVMVNYNNDIGDYMEYSNTGWVPIDISNEAYKLAVNYLIFSMTR